RCVERWAMIESIFELSGSSPQRSIPPDDWAIFAAMQFLRGPHIPRLTTLSLHGGFSGARLWRCQHDDHEYCLRAWPHYVNSRFLRKVHPLIKKARAAGHIFVPDL